MPQAASTAAEPRIIGRYALFDEIASGGMATVHLGRLLGPVGFGRTVAIKRLHEHYLKDPEFVTMFMDEARIVARIRHPNVVPMVDVVQNDAGIFLIMEYVHGESFSRLLRTTRAAGQPAPARIVATILSGVLMGLHAAHETRSADGELLGVVHRDVSPQNVIVGVDGVARMLDFGIAKAAGRAQITREGQIKGKLAYMAPEQIRGQVDRRTDLFAAAVVLWEALAGRRLHEGLKEVEIVTRVVAGGFPPPSKHAPNVTPELDALVLKALAIDPAARFENAREMAVELERVAGLAPAREVTEWVEGLAHAALATRAGAVNAMDRRAVDLVAAPSHPPAGAAPVVVPSVTLAMMPGMKPASTALTDEDGKTTVMDKPSFSEPPIDMARTQNMAQPASVARQPAAPPMMPASHPNPGPNTSESRIALPMDSVRRAPAMLTPLDGSPESAGEPRSMLAPILAVLLLFAVVGLSLGGYALYRRSTATTLVPSDPAAPPSVVPAASSAP